MLRAQLFHQLVRLETVLWNRLDSELRAEHGLSLGRIEVLYSIRESAPVGLAQLSSAMSVNAETLHRLVEWLELAGMCSRDDRATGNIEITVAGSALLIDIDRSTDRILRDLVGGTVPEDELARTATRLADILARLEPR